MKVSYLYLAVLTTLGVTVSQAVAEENKAIDLSPVRVQGEYIGQDYDESVISVVVIDREALNKSAATDLKSLVRYIPGVSVAKDAQKGVSQGLRIRGIDFNRITMSIDGDRLPEGQAWGHGSSYNAGRDFVEFDTLKRVDIMKEPNSAKHGSDTLAGAANFRTYDPEDFVSAEKPFHIGLKQGYASANRENKTTFSTAGFKNNFSWLVIGTDTSYHETKNSGDNDVFGKKRTKPNPLDAKGQNILGKMAWSNNMHRISIMAEEYKNNLTVDQMHDRSEGHIYDNTLKVKRNRYAIDYKLNLESAFFDEMNIRLYQNKLNNIDGIRNRFGGPTAKTTHTLTDFRVNIIGLRADFDKHLVLGGLDHDFMWGIDLRRTKTSRLEDINNSKDKQRKDFPDAVAKDIGFYLQDNISWGDGWKLSIGANIDHHTMNSSPDDIFLQYGKDNFTGNIDPKYLASRKYSDTTITPKINLSKSLFDNRAEAFIGYSEGVRHPSYENLGTFNHGGTHIVPNPDLKKESSRNYMAGLLYDDGWTNFSVNGYLSQYNNFIRSESFSDSSGQRYTMPMNVKRINIHGIEASFKQNITENWSLNGSAAWAKSKNRATGKELESDPFDKNRLAVDPFTYTVGLSYAQENWGASLDWKHVNAKNRQYKEKWGTFYTMNAPKYNLLDLTGWWKLDKDIEITGGIYNITNEKYWDGIDLQDEKAQDMWVKWYDHLDRWTQPGRNFAVSVKVSF